MRAMKIKTWIGVVAQEGAVQAVASGGQNTVFTATALVVLTVEATVDVTWIEVGGLRFWTNSWTCWTRDAIRLRNEIK